LSSNLQSQSSIWQLDGELENFSFLDPEVGEVTIGFADSIENPF